MECLKEIFRGKVDITDATVALFLLTMLKRLGNLFFRQSCPIQIPSQNLICVPSPIWNVPSRRKTFLTFIRLVQKCESPGTWSTWDKVLFLRYFICRIVCHTPSVLASLKSHLLNKHLFWVCKCKKPIPPWSFGMHKTPQFVRRYFFLCPSSAPLLELQRKRTWTLVDYLKQN